MSSVAATSSDRGLRWLIALQGVWLALVFGLAAWWATVLMDQAEQIVVLQRAAGLAEEAQLRWDKTQRMLFWESATFFFLLAATSLALITIYWRDLKRTVQIRTFFASVTHELRTPLTSIRLQAESIAEAMPPDSSTTSLVQRLLEDTQRLESEVERTLQLARLKGGGALYLQGIQLCPFIDRIAQSWREQYAGRAEVTVTCSGCEDVSIDADPSAVSVVLRNLFENSVKHSRKSPVHIQIQAQPTPGGLSVKVTDDGLGYPGDAKRLGDLFHRGEASHGSGIGLHLVRELMGQMGGSATFYSLNPGFGSTLQFREAKSSG